jgi:indolepyruvate ferredoxin oxidoreductase beta subunit
LQKAEEVGEALIALECARRNIREIRVFKPDLPSARMQNMVVLAKIDHHRLIPEIKTDHYRKAMTDLMHGEMLEKNLAVFDAER